jgi:lipopolysaccharide/colanic/teichoic acid biosynthesis glycosyltransferase
MSLIGPRPEVPEYVEFDDHRWRTVLAVRPGITDLATLAFRNEEAILGPATDPGLLPIRDSTRSSAESAVRTLLRDFKLCG